MDELGSLFKALGENITKKDLQKLVKENDPDGSGAIDRVEFLNMMAAYTGRPDSINDIRRAFSEFDKVRTFATTTIAFVALYGFEADASQDGGGSIDAHELMRVCQMKIPKIL